MTDYDVTPIESNYSVMSELDPFIIGRIEKLMPYIYRFFIYIFGGILYITVFYLILLVLGGVINEA